ncbi:ATP-binding protein [Patescibacteria group bacterium]
MKYNWSIVGHEKQLSIIESDLESGNLAHAYLLAGPNSVGKHTVAKKLAGILQCKNDFCHRCHDCVQVFKGTHLDTIELKDDRHSIKIEDIRKIIERLNMTRQSNYKLLTIQSIERMTPEASNSLLKTLEEPPPKTIFLLTTNRLHLVLNTVLSRVRIIKFMHSSYSYLFNKLRELYPSADDESLKKVCLFAMGKTGKALHLMENPDSLADYLHVYNRIQDFLSSERLSQRFSYVQELINKEVDLDTFFSILTNILRSKMMEEKGESLRKKYVKNLLNIEEAGVLLNKNVNAKLILENLMLSL